MRAAAVKEKPIPPPANTQTPSPHDRHPLKPTPIPHHRSNTFAAEPVIRQSQSLSPPLEYLRRRITDPVKPTPRR